MTPPGPSRAPLRRQRRPTSPTSIDKAELAIYDDLIHGFGGAYLPPISRTRQTRGSTHPEDFAYDQAGTVLVVQPNIITKDEKVDPLRLGRTPENGRA